MFRQRFLRQSQGKHCRYCQYTSSWEIVNAAETPPPNLNAWEENGTRQLLTRSWVEVSLCLVKKSTPPTCFSLKRRAQTTMNFVNQTFFGQQIHLQETKLLSTENSRNSCREATRDGTRHDSRGKGNHSPFKTNKEGSLRRLANLVPKLEKLNSIYECNAVIQEQLEAGIVEHAAPTVE